MEIILGVVQSPFFMGALVLLGAASIIRLIIANDPALKRAYGDDRRAMKSTMPELPFHDSDGVLVTVDRRTQPDRRQHRLMAMNNEMGQDNVT